MALAPVLTPSSANDHATDPASPEAWPAPRPPGSAARLHAGTIGPGSDAPVLVRLLQFLLDAPTAEVALHRATVSLGLLGEVAWAELDGDEAADLHAEFVGTDGLPHRIDAALSDPGDASDRAAVMGILTLVDQVYRRLVEVERLRADATTDPLTGLWNRRGFEPLLDQALARAARTGEAIAVVLVDVDRFKEVNDGWGHAVGDQALIAVAASLRGGVRPTDVVARTGGDEFAILLSGSDADGATLVCERIRRMLGRTEFARGGGGTGAPGVTLSFGVADVASIGRPTAGPAARAAWLAAADAALYHAKAVGRDAVVCHGRDSGVIEDDMTQPICVRAS